MSCEWTVQIAAAVKLNANKSNVGTHRGLVLQQDLTVAWSLCFIGVHRMENVAEADLHE